MKLILINVNLLFRLHQLTKHSNKNAGIAAILLALSSKDAKIKLAPIEVEPISTQAHLGNQSSHAREEVCEGKGLTTGREREEWPTTLSRSSSSLIRIEDYRGHFTSRQSSDNGMTHLVISYRCEFCGHFHQQHQPVKRGDEKRKRAHSTGITNSSQSISSIPKDTTPLSLEYNTP